MTKSSQAIFAQIFFKCIAACPIDVSVTIQTTDREKQPKHTSILEILFGNTLYLIAHIGSALEFQVFCCLMQFDR